MRLRVARKVMRVGYFRGAHKDSTVGLALDTCARAVRRRPWWRGTRLESETAACFEAVGPGDVVDGSRLTANGWSRGRRRVSRGLRLRD